MRFPFGETWIEIRRGEKDWAGQSTEDSEREIPGCAFVWDGVSGQDFQRNSAVTTGRLAVPKEFTIATNSVLKSPKGDRFSIIGPPQWDGVHPMSGWDPGLREYRLKGVTSS